MNNDEAEDIVFITRFVILHQVCLAIKIDVFNAAHRSWTIHRVWKKKVAM